MSQNLNKKETTTEIEEGKQASEKTTNDKINFENKRRKALFFLQTKDQFKDGRSSTFNLNLTDNILSPATDGQVMQNKKFSTIAQSQFKIQQQLPPIRKSISKDKTNILNKSQNEKQHITEQQEEEIEPLCEQKQGLMCFGDIITLLTKHKFEGGDNSFHGIMSAEGIAFTPVQCISQKCPTQPNSAVHTFRTCLFRVECHAKPQHQKAEMERRLGQQVRYGQLIQLKHLHSSGFINIESQVAKEHGCLRACISAQGFNFQVLNGNKLKTTDQVVSYSDQILLSCKVDKNQYYLHCNSKAL